MIPEAARAAVVYVGAMMRRRDFLWSLAAAPARDPALVIPGSVLVHEHILVDFGGVKNPSKYDRGEVLRVARGEDGGLDLRHGNGRHPGRGARLPAERERAQERTETEKFGERTERVFARSIDANRQRAIYVPLLSFLPLLAQATVLLVGRAVAGRALEGPLRRLDGCRRLFRLGPDLCDPDADLELAAHRLERLIDPQRSIGEALLDQRVACGVGNVYRCDVLFLHGLHPVFGAILVGSYTSIFIAAPLLIYLGVGEDRDAPVTDQPSR